MNRNLKVIIKKIITNKYHLLFIDLFLKCKYFFLYFLYTGTEFECLFCKRHFRKLLPGGYDVPVLRDKDIIGGGYRENAICPYCYSSDRERLVYFYLKNKTDFFNKSLKVLHIAPEWRLEKVLKKHLNINYLTADLNSPLTKVNIDITKINFKDNLFDVIICNHVLEHIPDDRKAMSELYRVLQPGGRAILQVPISLSLNKTYEDHTITTPERREKVFGQSDHVRIYAMDYKDRLEDIGFSVEVYNPASEYHESIIQRFGFLKKENLYICSK